MITALVRRVLKKRTVEYTRKSIWKISLLLKRALKVRSVNGHPWTNFHTKYHEYSFFKKYGRQFLTIEEGMLLPDGWRLKTEYLKALGISQKERSKRGRRPHFFLVTPKWPKRKLKNLWLHQHLLFILFVINSKDLFGWVKSFLF